MSTVTFNEKFTMGKDVDGSVNISNTYDDAMPAEWPEIPLPPVPEELLSGYVSDEENSSAHDGYFGSSEQKSVKGAALPSMQSAAVAMPTLNQTGQTNSSITVTVTYPNSTATGNMLKYYNFDTKIWTNVVAGKENNNNNGAYTFSGLLPGRFYYVYARCYDSSAGWSEDVRITAVTTMPAENLQTYDRSNFTFKFDKCIGDLFSAGRLDRFFNKLNNAYDYQLTLTGVDKPFNGAKSIFQTSRNPNESWEGYSGLPTYWNTNSLLALVATDHIVAMNRVNADMTEIPLHEIGHNFQSYTWCFEPEALAYFQAYYYLYMTGESIGIVGKPIISGSAGYKAYIKSQASRVDNCVNYDAAIAANVYSPYLLTYRLALIVDQIGFDPFKKTFRYFNSLPYEFIPTSNLEKFKLFIAKLRDFSGVDILSTFTATEKALIGGKLGGTVAYYPSITNAFIIFSNIDGNNNGIPKNKTDVRIDGKRVYPYYYMVKLSDLTYIGASTKVKNGNVFEITINGQSITFTKDSSIYNSVTSYSILNPADNQNNSYYHAVSGKIEAGAEPTIIDGEYYIPLKHAANQAGALYISYKDDSNQATVYHYRVNGTATGHSDDNTYFVGGPWLTDWNLKGPTKLSMNFTIGELRDNSAESSNKEYYSQLKISRNQLQVIENIRYHYNDNSAATINSGFRSWKNNLNTTGADIRSLHTRGRACDLSNTSSIYSNVYDEFKGTNTEPTKSGSIIWQSRVYGTPASKSQGFEIENMPHNGSTWLHIATKPAYSTDM